MENKSFLVPAGGKTFIGTERKSFFRVGFIFISKNEGLDWEPLLCGHMDVLYLYIVDVQNHSFVLLLY